MLNVVVLNVANKPFMLNVTNKLSVVMLNVANKPFMLNVVMLSVVALLTYLFESYVVKTLIKG
jgi:hypothetical protein